MQSWIVVILMLTAALTRGEAPAGAWAAPEEAARLVQDLQAFLEGAEVRRPGSPGNLAMEAKVAQRFAATGLPHGEIRFTAPAFLPGKTTLLLEGQAPVALEPMHPSLFRPGNFTEREFAARLVYLGRGEPTDLDRIKGTDLAGALAVMEFDCGSAWLRFLRLGVKGFIFLGAERYDRVDALAKTYATEVAVPRFFVDGAPAAAVKAAALAAKPVRVQAEPSRWENRELRDLYVLIPGSDPDLAREVGVIVAPLDGNSIVPGRATGAQNGANLYLLMRLLDDFQKRPPRRSILLAAVNAHTQKFLGERMLAWHMLADGVEDVRDALNADRREAKLIMDHYRQLRLDQFRPEDEALLISWRALLDDSTGKNVSIKAPLVSMARRDVNQTKNDQLQLIQQNLAPAEFDARRQALSVKRERFVNVLTLFNKVGRCTKLSDLSAEEREILKGYVRDVMALNQKNVELNEYDLERDKQNSAVREMLKGRSVPFVICLELDWSSPNLGFASYNSMWLPRPSWGPRWGANTSRIAAELNTVAREDKANLLMDTMTLRGGLGEDYYLPIWGSMAQDYSARQYFHGAGRTPAVSLMNVFTRFGRGFLPDDTVAGLNAANLVQQMAFVPALLRGLLDDAQLTQASELGRADPDPRGAGDWSIQVKTYKFDPLAANVVPDIPVSGSVVILRPWQFGNSVLTEEALAAADVINAYIVLTDQRATAMFYALRTATTSEAFHYDADFIRADHAIDAGEAQNKVNSNKLGKDLVFAMFECREFPFYAVADSSLIAATSILVQNMIPLTARGNAAPRKFGVVGVESAMTTKFITAGMGAPVAFYFVPDEWMKVITLEKRLALNATAKDVEGRGYANAGQMGPDLFADSARDMSVLNHARLSRLKAVAGDLAVEFLQRGDQCLARMQQALAQRDPLSYLQALYEGLGAQVKSYEQIKQTRDDMLKAVVVYMALLLPFCFFIQKLLFKFVKIEHEMGMFALLFVVTFIVFRMIHPAFRVAQAAEAIFIAFIMGALALFVISILRGRFEGEMQIIFRNLPGAGMDEDVGYSTVTQKALMIGVNNMKRRRIRTMLTTATIVLVAFTMLSFTSVSKRVNPTLVTKSREAPYTGFMYHWPGNSRMDEATLDVMRNLCARRGQAVVRRWLMARDTTPFHVVSSAGGAAQMNAIMGLSVAEDGFLGRIPLVAGRYFQSDDAEEVILSSAAAEVLKIDPDQLAGVEIGVQGKQLKVAGIVDDSQFRAMQDLNGISILPIQQVVREASGSQGSGPIPDVELSDLGVLVHVDPNALLIVPEHTAARLGAQPYSISLKIKDPKDIWQFADLILTATKAKFYIGSLAPFMMSSRGDKPVAAGVYYIGSNYTTSIGGLAILLIPLFIASTIILNTMLGSVYERKKEIAVYNAIGLNPHHIGMFFLAESFVYGVIGSVGGYLIGQVLSLTLNKAGWVKDINFNYSSLSVAYVILFTIAVVLLSTLYPAVVATKAAVPSGKRKWALPPHDGHTMRVVFPFIYQPRFAQGIMAYLQTYFSRFTEASIGDLIATPEGQTRGRDPQGRESWLLKYHTALVPYDLGVTQHLDFELAYDNHVQAYRLELCVRRISGQDTNWVTTNRPFLERLRKYLMRWRNLPAAQQDLYVRQAKQLFGES